MSDPAGRVLGKLKDDIAGEMQRVVSALDAIRRDPGVSRDDKRVATLQHEAAIDALAWVFEQTDRYYTPVDRPSS